MLKIINAGRIQRKPLLSLAAVQCSVIPSSPKVPRSPVGADGAWVSFAIRKRVRWCVATCEPAASRKNPSGCELGSVVPDPASADARACIEAYFRELQERFESGFDPARTVSANPEELVPPAGLFLIARLDGRPVGCGGLKASGRKVGEIKRMWVAPDARGLGIAQRLLDAIEEQAVRMGLHTLQLDTNRALKEAHALYTRNGYVEIPRYNDNPYADHWFEKRRLKGSGSAR